MRPQNYVCVLVASSGITFISSLIFFPLELFHTQNHPALPKSLYLSSGNFNLFVLQRISEAVW